MRKNYVKPILNSEEFVADFCATACFNITCLVTRYGGIMGGEDFDNDGITGNHNTDGCRKEGNTIIRIDDLGNYKIFEESNDNWDANYAKILTGRKVNGYYVDEQGTVTKEQLIAKDTIVWSTSGTTLRGDWESIHIGIPSVNRTPNHS